MKKGQLVPRESGTSGGRPAVERVPRRTESALPPRRPARERGEPLRQRGGQPRERPDAPVRRPSPAARRSPEVDGQAGSRGGHRTRVAVAVASVLTLVITGFAWQSVDTLRSSIATAGGLGLGGGADGAVDILMVGTDSRTDAHGNALSSQEMDSLRAGDEVASNTDTIVLIRIPDDGSSATAISIPRDAYVDVPGIGMSKINAAYGATKEADRIKLVESGVGDADADQQSSQAGREALIESVANLTGITVDHYAEVGLLGFVLLTNAIGGVDVCLNNPVDEPLSGANFPAGPQTLNGADALSFVRQRHDLPRGDLDRIVRQQVFMASLVHKILSAKTLSNPGKLSQLADALQRSVVLDSDWDVLQFASKLQDLAGGKVKFQTVPVVDINATSDSGESIVQVDPATVKKFVAGLVDGNTESTTAPTPEQVDPSSVVVDVANDSGISGMATGVSDSLSALGYKPGAVGNYDGASVSASRVFANDTGSAAAQSVSAAIGGVQVLADSTLAPDTVRIVLADDYAGPGSEGYVAPSAGDVASPSNNQATVNETSATQPAPAIDAGTAGPPCVN